MPDAQREHLETFLLRELAVAAGADPRSVRRELLHPGAVRGLAGERIRRALHALRTAGAPSTSTESPGQCGLRRKVQ